MRQTIFGLVAAIAVMTAGAAPALACGYSTCAPCGAAASISPCAPSYAPAYTGTGCAGGCDGWAYERLAEPDTQYYYVNQGPTFSGPGRFAPYPTYRQGSYRWHHHYHFLPHHYGYGTHRLHYGYHDGRPVLRRYD